MNKLLKEFLSYIVTERVTREPNTSWQAKNKTWSAKRSDGTRQDGFGSKNAADAWLAGTSGAAGDDISTDKQKPKKQSTTPTKTPSTPSTSSTGTTPRKKKEKIEPVSTTTDGVISSFGETSLDTSGLLKAVQGIPSEEKGEKGAGSIDSTAGEAAATLGIERLRTLRQQNPDMSTDEFLRMADGELTKLMSELRGVPDSALNSEWAVAARNQALAVFHTVETRFGTKISEMGWDNAVGRRALGLPPKKEADDRSDVYIRTQDGRIIGVSLKKDGKVILANDGLKKALDKIAAKAPPAVKQRIVDISKKHTETVDKGFNQLTRDVAKNKTSVTKRLGELTRDDIPDVDSEKYNKYFDETGKLKPEVIAQMTSGNPGKRTGITGVLFIKTMTSISETEPSVKNGLTMMRAADGEASQSLLSMVGEDEGVRTVVTDFLINGLDLPQLVTQEKPFGQEAGVDGFFVAYGSANVQEDGSRNPMVVTRKTILDTLGLPEDTTDEQFKEAVSRALVIDSEESGKVGFIRLKARNNNPPPPNFYPSIAELGVRAKGLGRAATLAMEQGSGWTYALLNGTPDPSKWPVHQRKAHAEDSIQFLYRQLRTGVHTEEQRANIEQEIAEFKRIKGEQ